MSRDCVQWWSVKGVLKDSGQPFVNLWVLPLLVTELEGELVLDFDGQEQAAGFLVRRFWVWLYIFA